MSIPLAPRGPTLRIVCVNDVYSLENFPRLRTLVQRAADTDPADVLMTALVGDFVAPSMLSSLDAGRGMVDCMNAVPITHAILGNHEDDIPVAELHARIREFRGAWLSTNILDLDPKLRPVAIIEVHGEGTRRVRVGLVGVVMDDPTVYRGTPFGGATLLPANETALAAAARLVADEGCACVIPLTHQSLAADRELARAAPKPRFPVIVGGHEHVVAIEQIDGTWLVKAGIDAAHAVIVDLAWPARPPPLFDGLPGRGPEGAADLPEVRVRLEDVTTYAEDPALRARVDEHMRALLSIEEATLLRLKPGEVLSSAGSRARQTTVGELLASRLRDAFGAEASVINGGGIRAGRKYEQRFTYGDLKAEVPFENEVVVASIPGSVLREAIAASRARAPAESGGFLQVDDRMFVAEPGDRLVAVGGAPLDEDRGYRVALVRNIFEGMDHIEPLVRFARDNPARIPPEGSGCDIKVALVNAFSRTLWEQLGHFDAIDQNQDGYLDAKEIADAVARVTAEPASKLTVELLIKALDTDDDKVISRREAEALRSKP